MPEPANRYYASRNAAVVLCSDVHVNTDDFVIVAAVNVAVSRDDAGELVSAPRGDVSKPGRLVDLRHVSPLPCAKEVGGHWRDHLRPIR